MKNNKLFLLGLLIPAYFVYKAVFIFGSLALGDAPYFYKEAMDIFLRRPVAWWDIGNGLGSTNLFIWIAPLMYIYSFLGSVLGLGHSIVVRLVFYFPAIIFSFVTPFIFTKYFKFSKITQFFTSLVYGLNTYLILLIDGGQVGVALAYSIFPVVLLQLYRLTEKWSLNSFSKALLTSFFLILMDPRIAIIAFLTIAFWRPKKIFNLILLGLTLIPLNMFWLLPLLRNGGGDLSLEVSSLGQTSLLHSLLLYQPHWPNNIYGQIIYPPFYFVFVAILVFGGLLFKKDKNSKIIKTFSLLFLAFAFLTKGETAPLGFIYKFVVTRFPFGSTLRDSSKFFTPLMLFGGVLIGNTVDKFKSKVVKIVCFVFLLLLILPALLGKLNFVLSGRSQSGDYQKIYTEIKNNPGEYKTLWFPEKPTLGFQSEKKPAINAKSLIELRPFASISVGSSDVFNFFNNPSSSGWIQNLGVRYMFFPGSTRRLEMSEEEQKDWQTLLANVSENPSYKELDWNTEMRIFEVLDTQQNSFEAEKVYVIAGGEDVYDKKKIDPTKVGTIFLEDEKTDANKLLGMPRSSFELLYNDKNESDLRFSFLKDYYLEQSDISKLEWAKYSADNYLLWKYQLLIRGIQTFEFDYGKGIILSTNENESVEYKTKIKESGKYIVAVRGMGYQDNELLISVNGVEKTISQKSGSFGWQYLEVDLKKGTVDINLTNKSGMQVLNTVAVIPVSSWQESEIKTNEFITKFANKNDINPKWIIYSQNYHPLWKLDCGNKQISSTPVYAMINGFLIDDCEQTGEIYFDGQKNVDLGIKISLASFVIILLWLMYLKNHH
ncbi:hypothetical protein ISR94_02375 [Candidatus Microgenomates bacterium]|nr:hypothetical protein [Candidatus Microgenomates bacterium]